MKNTRTNALLNMLTAGLLSSALTTLIYLLAKEKGILQDSDLAQTYCSTAWHNVVHGTHNAFFVWRQPFCISSYPHLLLSALCSFIFATGFTLLLSNPLSKKIKLQLSRLERITQLIIAASCTPILITFFGIDQTLLYSLALLPWLILSLSQFAPYHWVALPSVTLALSNLSHQYALVVSILALILAPLFAIRVRTTSAIVVLLISYISVSFTPVVDFPYYPQGARLVSDDGIAEVVRPLLGHEYPMEVVDKVKLSTLFKKPITALFLLSLLLVSTCSRSKEKLKAALTLFLIVLLGTNLLPSDLQMIAPLASLERLIPHTNILPLAPLFTAIGIMLILASITQFKRLSSIALLIYISCATYNAPHIYIPSSQVALEQQPASPSAAIVRDTKRLSPQTDELNAQDLSTIQGVQISTSTNGANKKFLIDGKKGTLWSTNQAKQTGQEWIQIEFPRTLSLMGLTLNPGRNSTDFPRGISVGYADKCTDTLQTAFNQTPWKGPVRFTDEGLAYYGPQQKVRIVFNKEIQAQCLKIRQTAVNHNFDWSVAEVRLLVLASAQ